MWLKPKVKFDFINPSAKANGNSERIIIKNCRWIYPTDKREQKK